MPKAKQSSGRTPNLRQQRAVEIIAENHANGKIVPMTQVLQQAGYSNVTIAKPKNVTKSKTFQELLDKMLPAKALIKKHKDLMNAANIIDSFIFSNALTDKEIKAIVEYTPGCVFIRTVRNQQNAHAYFYRPDNPTQLKAVELGYKVQKKLGNDGGGDAGGYTEEIKAVILHIRKILPPAGA
jgi:glycine betaine/choline ABC-type transport system substrate-binding protein